jgi:hypothetical protein
MTGHDTAWQEAEEAAEAVGPEAGLFASPTWRASASR